MEGYDGCAVGVHDRQDNRIGRPSIEAKTETTPKKTRKEEGTPVNSIVSVKHP